MSRTVYNLGQDNGEKTSVKVSNPSGGKSSISLAWDADPQPEQTYNGKKYKNASSVFSNDPVEEKKKYETSQPEKTSVKVHYAPGGASTLSLGGEGPTSYSKSSTTKGGYYQQEPIDQTYVSKYEKKFESYSTKGPTTTQTTTQTKPTTVQTQDSSPTKTSVRVNNPPGGKSSISFY